MESSSAIRLYVPKNYEVSPERLFEAWNREEDLREWWHPLGHQLQKVTNVLQEGGRVNYEFCITNEGPSLHIEGAYKEVRGKEKLVYSWNWKMEEQGVGNAEYLLEVRFLPRMKGVAWKRCTRTFPMKKPFSPTRKDGKRLCRTSKVTWRKSKVDGEPHLRISKDWA